ncbi:MAG: CpsD/CapB family tyrosine-protein kinase [Eubacteriales bacterium]|nr:CpsD/CapB family tyrosine-protein kinase [Eubacteriales bacterium]
MNKLTIERFPALSYAQDEALNTLCTNLFFAGEGIRTVMFTSCRASEGKSFLTMNTMRTMASLGKRVVLVDADLRCSAIRSTFRLSYEQPDSGKGLAHWLVGLASAEEILYRTNIERACIVPVGREVSNSLPLLNSPRLPRLLDMLAGSFDYVLVDAPPVGAIIDAAQIAKHCDGSLIVVGYNQVHRRELIEAREQLEQSGSPVLGAVLNMVGGDGYVSRNYYRKTCGAEYPPAGERAPRRKPVPAAKK